MHFQSLTLDLRPSCFLRQGHLPHGRLRWETQKTLTPDILSNQMTSQRAITATPMYRIQFLNVFGSVRFAISSDRQSTCSPAGYLYAVVFTAEAARCKRQRFFVAAMILFMPSALIRRLGFEGSGAGSDGSSISPLILAHRAF